MSFPSLNPYILYICGPSFTSAEVDQQHSQIRFIILGFVLHFVGRTVKIIDEIGMELRFVL